MHYITVGLQILAAIVSIIALVISWYNSNQTNKLAKEKIDADIKARSRINWIQNVREATVQVEDSFRNLYIVSYENKVNVRGTYNKQLEMALTKYQNKLNMLILYFGSKDNDDSELNIEKELKTVATPNDINLFDDLELKEARQKVKDNGIEIEEAKKINQKVLDKLLDKNRTDNSGLNGIIVSLLNQLNKNSNISFGSKGDNKKFLVSTKEEDNTRVINKYVLKIVPIMSLYLKIEWDIAKNGN